MIRPPLEDAGQLLRDQMQDGSVLMPGAFSALSAAAAVKQGAQAVYLSGGAMTNNLLGAPDIALASLDEFAGVAEQTCSVVQVPVLSDADTGFGEVWNVVRTVIAMERAGLAGIHLEDQISPKRCGHLDGKGVIETSAMASKIRAAVSAKRKSSFMIFARTDARGVEGLESAIDRAKAYVDAGADGIFPEGLASESEFEQFRAALPNVPLLANMTEFGKTPLITHARFQELGYNIVIFPVTALRVMLKAIEEFYSDLLRTGTQADWISRMRTRVELYETVEYSRYPVAEAEFSAQS